MLTWLREVAATVGPFDRAALEPGLRATLHRRRSDSARGRGDARQAIARRRGRHRRLHHRLYVTSGYLSHPPVQAMLVAALAVWRWRGFIGALAAHSFAGVVAATPLPRISVLTIGQIGPAAATVSSQFARCVYSFFEPAVGAVGGARTVGTHSWRRLAFKRCLCVVAWPSSATRQRAASLADVYAKLAEYARSAAHGSHGPTAYYTARDCTADPLRSATFRAFGRACTPQPSARRFGAHTRPTGCACQQAAFPSSSAERLDQHCRGPAWQTRRVEVSGPRSPSAGPCAPSCVTRGGCRISFRRRPRPRHLLSQAAPRTLRRHAHRVAESRRVALLVSLGHCDGARAPLCRRPRLLDSADRCHRVEAGFSDDVRPRLRAHRRHDSRRDRCDAGSCAALAQHTLRWRWRGFARGGHLVPRVLSELRASSRWRSPRSSCSCCICADCPEPRRSTHDCSIRLAAVRLRWSAISSCRRGSTGVPRSLLADLLDAQREVATVILVPTARTHCPSQKAHRDARNKACGKHVRPSRTPIDRSRQEPHHSAVDRRPGRALRILAVDATLWSRRRSTLEAAIDSLRGSMNRFAVRLVIFRKQFEERMGELERALREAQKVEEHDG